MIFLLIAILVCAGIGSGANYVGVWLIIEAFSLQGGNAIGVFSGGIVLVISSVAIFAMVAMLGKVLFEEIKEHLK